MSKVIVTGGCGFIGSHLVDKLVDIGYSVIVIDDLSASENDKFYYNNNATYYHLDICDISLIDKLFIDVEYVFHLAAESRIQPAILNPNRAYSVNVLGTLNILELCKKYKIKRIIYSSTSSVYGLTKNIPTSEQVDTDCLNPYSHSKLLGESLVKQYYKNYKLDSVILRYFNVFGERSPVKGQYAPVVGIFLNQVKCNTELTIVGDGSRKRDFIYVLDVVDANIRSMLYKEDLNGDIFNVGSGENFSIKEVADYISDNQINIPDRIGEADDTLADIRNITTKLSFKPNVSIFDWLKNKITT